MQATVLAAQAFISLIPFLVVVMTWSADRYGLIGVAFTIQSWLLAAAFVVVVGAVIGAVASEKLVPA